MRTFAELTGLSPTVLRAWERRHGLLEPARPDGGHRLYTDEDLAVIRRVSELLEQGRAIGEIAALGRDGLLDQLRPLAPEPAARAEPDTLDKLRSQIVEAARRLDDSLLAASLDRAFALFSLEIVLSNVIQPAAYEIGEGWARGEISVAGEHMVSAELSARIERLRQAMTHTHRDAPLVVCGCIPGEQHELGLLMLALRISSGGYRVAYLGRDLPIDEVQFAAERLGAGAVCLSAKLEETVARAKPSLLALARHWDGRRRVHLGGVDDADNYRALTAAGVYVWDRNTDIQRLFDELFHYS